MFKTNLNILHNAHRIKTGRNVGKTVYSCHVIAGQLLTLPEGSTVGVLVPNFQYLESFEPTLVSILSEYGIHIVNKSLNSIFIMKSANCISLDPGIYSRVKFIFMNSKTIEFSGFGIGDSQYVVVDSYEFNDELTVTEFYNKLKNFNS